MKFRDAGLDDNGEPVPGGRVGIHFVSDDECWRVIASDVNRPHLSEWRLFQHVDAAESRDLASAWRRRLPWMRFPLPEHAQAVAETLAALPASASWEVARVAVRNTLRSVGGAAFFRSMYLVNRGATLLLAARERARAREAGGGSSDAGQ